MTSHVYAYYAPLGNPDGAALTTLWLDDWRAQGWTPHLLGPADALTHPRRSLFLAHCRSLPTINDANFELACYERWLAFASIPGYDPVAVTDFDVFAVRPYPPRDYPAGLYSGDSQGGPGWIVGTPASFTRILNALSTYTPQSNDLAHTGQPHVSDMTILQRNRSTLYDHIDDTHRCYNTPGWRDFPLTHFGNGYLRGGQPKSAEIAAVLAAERGTK